MRLPETASSTALDEAFERLAGAGFELPNGFVNHGAMACEALAELGFDDQLDAWARRFSRIAGNGVEPKAPGTFDWCEALGDYRRLPEWIGLFQAEIDDEGWAQVLDRWVPRLLPGLATALFHGTIRVAHAARAMSGSDTDARREELARALGYWAARSTSGRPAARHAVEHDSDVHAQVLGAAGEAARFYIAAPSIYNLHGVTGAMAVELLVPHIAASAGVAALAQLRVEHAALYEGMGQTNDLVLAGASEDAVAVAAASSRDPHQVKLVEACRRGSRLTGDGAFAAAAETATGMAG